MCAGRTRDDAPSHALRAGTGVAAKCSICGYYRGVVGRLSNAREELSHDESVAQLAFLLVARGDRSRAAPRPRRRGRRHLRRRPTSSAIPARSRPTSTCRGATGRFPACWSSTAARGGWARACQLAGVAQMLAEHGFTAVAISYRLAPRVQVPRADRGLQSGRPLDAHRSGQVEDRPRAHRRLRLLGRRPPGVAPGNDRRRRRARRRRPIPTTLPSTRLQAVAAGGAPCDFRPIPPDVDGLAFWLGGTPARVPEQYRLASPAAFVTADDPPIFFFHGESDQIVPLVSPTQMRPS